jgi:hypothetical protein
MLADKKKLAIIALVVVILGIGAFQMTSGGSSAPAPGPKKASHHEPTASSHDTTGKTAALNNAMGQPAPDGTAPAGTSPAAGTPGTLEAGKQTKVAVAEYDLPERDPFDGGKFLPREPVGGAPAPQKPLSNHMSSPPVMPTIGGTLPAPGGQIVLPNVPGQAPVKPVDTFDYTVSGVVTGDRPAAVFSDSKGNQRLIQVGASLDGDTKVIAISRGKVTVRYHGKTITKTVGADNPTEKRSDEK